MVKHRKTRRSNKLNGRLRLRLVLYFVGIIVIASATVFVLRQVIPSKPAVQSAKEAVDIFTQQATTYLSPAHYQKVDKPTNTTIRYSGTSKRAYDIYLSAAVNAQYAKEDTSVKSNDSAVISKYEALLSEYGLTKSSSNDNVTGYLATLFENDKVACQTDNWQSYDKHSASYGIACVNKADITKSYDDTDALLAKASADMSASDVRLINSAVITSTDKKQLTVLTTKQADSSSLTLYYLNTSKGWGYVGVRPTPSVDIESSFAIPDKLKTAIQASPEKDFLTTYILR